MIAVCAGFLLYYFSRLNKKSLLRTRSGEKGMMVRRGVRALLAENALQLAEQARGFLHVDVAEVDLALDALDDLLAILLASIASRFCSSSLSADVRSVMPCSK